MRFVGLALLVVIAAVAAVYLLAAPPKNLEPATAEPPAATGWAPKTWALADQSCAASSCHGGVDAHPKGRGGHEASVWLSYDPHARAYDVLQTDLARQMVAILRTHDRSWAPDATKEVRCLACHSSPLAERPTEAKEFGDDGVSCRSCHGEASSWLDAHTEAALGAVHQPAARKEAYAKSPALAGLRFLGTARHRAETCVGCHVGAKAGVDGLPRREVDHDLIAAGHPRLVFDLASQSTRQPRHWRDRPKPDLPAEWAEGQTAALRALADLAASRPGGPRLDFADQSCVQCHRELDDAHRRVRDDSEPSRRRGDSLGKPSWAAPYAPAAAWLSNRQQLMQSLTDVQRASPAELPAALSRLSAAANENAALDGNALPPPNALHPNDRDALLAEYRAQLAADPHSPRVAELKTWLQSHSK